MVVDFQVVQNTWFKHWDFLGRLSYDQCLSAQDTHTAMTGDSSHLESCGQWHLDLEIVSSLNVNLCLAKHLWNLYFPIQGVIIWSNLIIVFSMWFNHLNLVVGLAWSSFSEFPGVLPQKNVKQLPTLPALTPRGGLLNDPRSRTPNRQGSGIQGPRYVFHAFDVDLRDLKLCIVPRIGSVKREPCWRPLMFWRQSLTKMATRWFRN